MYACRLQITDCIRTTSAANSVAWSLAGKIADLFRALIIRSMKMSVGVDKESNHTTNRIFSWWKGKNMVVKTYSMKKNIQHETTLNGYR
jgi:hypothetical protein